MQPEQLKQAHQQQPHPTWKTLRQQRREAIYRRQQENEDWRQKREALRQRTASLPSVTSWLATLTSLLPPHLQFLISD